MRAAIAQQILWRQKVSILTKSAGIDRNFLITDAAWTGFTKAQLDTLRIEIEAEIPGLSTADVSEIDGQYSYSTVNAGPLIGGTRLKSKLVGLVA